MKNIAIPFLIIGVFVAGIFIGKHLVVLPKVVQTTTITRYEPAPYPVEVEVPVTKLVPYEVQAVKEVPVFTAVDSVAIVADYLLRRKYDLDFSVDSLGQFVAHVDVQSNEVVKASATIQPTIKTIQTTNNIVVPPRTQMYVQLGSDLRLRTTKLSAGLDVQDRYLVGASAIRQNGWGYTIDFGVKF